MYEPQLWNKHDEWNGYVSHLFSRGRKKWKRAFEYPRPMRCAVDATCNSQYTCSETSWFEFASSKLYCSRRSEANRKQAIKIVPSIRRCRPGTNSGQNYVSKLDIPGHCAGIIGNPWRAIVCRTKNASGCAKPPPFFPHLRAGHQFHL